MINNILEAYRSDLYETLHKTINTYPLKWYPDTHVFDENKSVKWNREQVILYNKEYEQKKEQLQNEKAEAIRQICDQIAQDIYDYSDLDLTLPEIKLAVRYGVDKGDYCCMDNIFETIIAYLNFTIDHNALTKEE